MSQCPEAAGALTRTVLAAGVIAAVRKTRPLKLRVTHGLPAFPLILLAYVGWTAWRIWTFDGSTSRSADAAIVLGASTRNGEPSPVFIERIRHGIALAARNAVSRPPSAKRSRTQESC